MRGGCFSCKTCDFQQHAKRVFAGLCTERALNVRSHDTVGYTSRLDQPFWQLCFDSQEGNLYALDPRTLEVHDDPGEAFWRRQYQALEWGAPKDWPTSVVMDRPRWIWETAREDLRDARSVDQRKDG